MRTSFRNQRKRLSKTRRFRSRLNNRSRRSVEDLSRAIVDLRAAVSAPPVAVSSRVAEEKAEIAALAAEVVAAGIKLPTDVKDDLRDAGITVPAAAEVICSEAEQMDATNTRCYNPTLFNAPCTPAESLDVSNQRCYSNPNKVKFTGKDGRLYTYDTVTGMTERVVREKEIMVGDQKYMLDEDTGELRKVKVEVPKVEPVEQKLPNGRILLIYPDGKTEFKKVEVPKVEGVLPDGRKYTIDPETGKMEIKKVEVPKVEGVLPDGRKYTIDPVSGEMEILKAPPAPKQVININGRPAVMNGDNIQFLDELVSIPPTRSVSPRRSVRRSVSPVAVVQSVSPRRSVRRSVSPVRVVSVAALPDKCNVRSKKSCKKSSGCKWNNKNGCRNL